MCAKTLTGKLAVRLPSLNSRALTRSLQSPVDKKGTVAAHIYFAGVKETYGVSMKSPFIEFPCLSAFFHGVRVMGLLHVCQGSAVMESKQSQFWNAVSVAAFAILAGILTGYVGLLIVGDLPG
jgi:hypothetical protein